MKWTEEEELYLEKNWGKIKIASMAVKLNRSVKSIERKAYRMQLGGATQIGYYINISDLSRAINVNPNTIRNWIKNKGLKAKYMKLTKKRLAYQINIEDFWKWAQINQDSFNAANIEQNILGEEPSWLIAKRKEDYNLKNINKNLSDKDKEFINKYYKIRTYKEIASILYKSEQAIRSYINKSNLNKRNTKPWTIEEESYLLYAKSQGISNKDIAIKLNRTISSIEGKYTKLKNKEAA